MISIGRPRRVLPTNITGINTIAQRKISETAGRAAERARLAISTDAFETRLWRRNLRGSIVCPCSSRLADSNSTPLSENTGQIVLNSGQGDDLGAVDSGFPLEGQPITPNKLLPASEESNSFIDNISRLLLGDGRRCGLCWGTGWLDGHQLYGGQRFVCCAASTPWVELDSSASECDVDLDSPTPTFVGPGTLTWNITHLPSMNILDALRVREGLVPANSSGWTLTIFNANNPSGIDANSFLSSGLLVGQKLDANDIPTKMQLTLQENVCISHIEMVMRSEPLVNLQLPNLILTATTELVQPFVQEEFEIDPVISWLTRGSLFEIPARGSNIGSVWIAQDINENRTAEGLTWGITGSTRNVQPNEIYACVSMDDSIAFGLIDGGLGTRGLESTEASEPAGLNDLTDESLAAVKRGSAERVGGGTANPFAGIISLTPIREGD